MNQDGPSLIIEAPRAPKYPKMLMFSQMKNLLSIVFLVVLMSGEVMTL